MTDLAGSRGLSRETGQRGLDDLVRENRFTIAVVFPAVGAVLLVASREGWLADPLAFNPWLVLLGVLVMRLPLVAGVVPLVYRRAPAALVALAAYAYGVEWLGVTTGLPYGAFEYGVDLGPMLAGAIPVALPVFFLPLVLNAYLLCLLLLGERADRATVQLPVVVAAVVAMDLVFDPGDVALGFWSYDAGGVFYGVPLSNYLGWVLSASVAVAVLDRGLSRAALLDRLRSCDYMLDDLVSYVILWGAINAFYGNWAAVAVAALFGYGLLRTDRFDFSVAETLPLLGGEGRARTRGRAALRGTLPSRLSLPGSPTPADGRRRPRSSGRRRRRGSTCWG